MSRMINCECGYTMRAESEEQLLDQAMEHVETSHPDLAGKLTREDLLAMSEEEPAA